MFPQQWSVCCGCTELYLHTEPYIHSISSSSNHKSLLQKSPIKGTIFCKRDPKFEGQSPTSTLQRHLCSALQSFETVFERTRFCPSHLRVYRVICAQRALRTYNRAAFVLPCKSRWSLRAHVSVLLICGCIFAQSALRTYNWATFVVPCKDSRRSLRERVSVLSFASSPTTVETSNVCLSLTYIDIDIYIIVQKYSDVDSYVFILK